MFWKMTTISRQNRKYVVQMLVQRLRWWNSLHGMPLVMRVCLQNLWTLQIQTCRSVQQNSGFDQAVA